MMVNKNTTFCVYMTPCNYCSKFDKPCNEACDDKGKLKKAEVPAGSEAIFNLRPRGGSYCRIPCLLRSERGRGRAGGNVCGSV